MTGLDWLILLALVAVEGAIIGAVALVLARWLDVKRTARLGARPWGRGRA